MNDNKASEEIIADYMKKELAAYGIAEWDHGQLIYDGPRHSYLVEIKVHTLDKKPVRLTE